MTRNVKYDAFISYRPCKPDSEIASKLHKKLESYRLPKDVAKKVGKKSLNRVFRDEAELAVSDDLSESIEEAISNSKYLIAICSPEYLNSNWCMKEIEAFLKHSDRKHILLVLANGEPVDAFPEILKYDESIDFDDNGNEIIVKKPVEPLAADCRGENAKDRSNAVENAVLRLMASMIGVGYDDLNQRHRKEQNRKRTTRTLIAFSILGIFFAVCLFFLIKISKQNAIISQRYSDTLAATSVNLLRDGRKKDAVYVARMALDEKNTDSYSESATQALVNSLGIYNAPDILSCDRDIMLPCSLSEFMVSSEGNYISVRGLEYIRYVIDAETEDILFFYDDPDYGVAAFDGERGLLFQRKDENFSFYDFRNLAETDLGISDGRLINEDTANGYAIGTSDGVYLYKGPNLEGSFIFADEIPYLSDRFDTSCIYAPDGSRALIVIDDFENQQTYLFTYDFASGQAEGKTLNYKGIVYSICFDGQYIFWKGVDFFGCLTLYRQNLDDISDNVATGISDDLFDLVACDGCLVGLGYENLYVYDRYLNAVETVRVDSYIRCTVSSDEIVIVEEDKAGVHKIVNGKYSYCKIDAPEGRLLMSKDYKNSTLYLSGVGDNHISTYTFSDSEYIEQYNGVCDEIEYFEYDAFEKKVFKEKVMGANPDFSEDRIYDIAICENADYGIIQLWDGQVYICDSNTGKTIKTIYALDGMVRSFFYDEVNEYFYISADNVEVYDKKFKNIFRIYGCNLLGIDPATKNPVLVTWKDDEAIYYLIKPVKYNRLLQMADEFLGDFEPDQRVKEKYSLE